MLRLYDVSFGNVKGGRTNPPPPVRLKVAKHRIRARVNMVTWSHGKGRALLPTYLEVGNKTNITLT